MDGVAFVFEIQRHNGQAVELSVGVRSIHGKAHIRCKKDGSSRKEVRGAIDAQGCQFYRVRVFPMVALPVQSSQMDSCVLAWNQVVRLHFELEYVLQSGRRSKQTPKKMVKDVLVGIPNLGRMGHCSIVYLGKLICIRNLILCVMVFPRQGRLNVVHNDSLPHVSFAKFFSLSPTGKRAHTIVLTDPWIVPEYFILQKLWYRPIDTAVGVARWNEPLFEWLWLFPPDQQNSFALVRLPEKQWKGLESVTDSAATLISLKAA
mmetsp:Transcript_10891/g.22630  ORF Transcript_10891/g.22630 Transcript_10891/m.22630 type:complete len:261 (+) Transcript_10891:368-1150(+)